MFSLKVVSGLLEEFEKEFVFKKRAAVPTASKSLYNEVPNFFYQA